MNKNDFEELLSRFPAIADADLKEMEALTESHPYCQIGHLLVARASHDRDDPAKGKKLKLAAAYITNRALLKKLITGQEMQSPGAAVVLTPASPEPRPVVLVAEPGEKALVIETEEKKDDDQLRDEVSANLENLRQLRNKFMDAKPQDESRAEKNPEAAAGEEVPAAVSAAPAAEPAAEDDGTDLLLDYLTNITASKNIEENAELNREKQAELIDKFIKSGPGKISIDKNPPAEEERDLSEPSIREDENLVSENLAIILVKQGKTDKAIEIYRKLIWKYPQKKSYFADRIEELKKS